MISTLGTVQKSLHCSRKCSETQWNSCCSPSGPPVVRARVRVSPKHVVSDQEIRQIPARVKSPRNLGLLQCYSATALYRLLQHANGASRRLFKYNIPVCPSSSECCCPEYWKSDEICGFYLWKAIAHAPYMTRQQKKSKGLEYVSKVPARIFRFGDVQVCDKYSALDHAKSAKQCYKNVKGSPRGQQRLCPACCLEARPSDILHQNHNERFCIFDHLKESLKQLAIQHVESCRVGKQSNKFEFLDLDLTTDTRTYIHCIPLVSSWKLPTCLYVATLFSSSAGDILLLVVVHEGAEHTSEAQTFLHCNHCHMVHSLDTFGHFWDTISIWFEAPSECRSGPIHTGTCAICGNKKQCEALRKLYQIITFGGQPKQGSQKMRTSCGPLSTASGCLPVSDIQEWLMIRNMENIEKAWQHQHQISSKKVQESHKSL